MGLYGNHIFPRFYDCVVDAPHWREHRKQQLAELSGEVLEIGVGTGLNLPHYPGGVQRIVTADPNPGMNKRLRRRIEQTGRDVEQHVMRGEALPFDDGRFDAVVSTLTLCSIQAVDRAMEQVYRVLKPGGCFVFLEHGLSPDAKVSRWQRRLNGIQKLFADGCQLTVDINTTVRSQPFATVKVDCFYMEKTPKSVGYMYRGEAVK